MLTKVLKHEFKYTVRIFPLLFAAYIAIALVTKLFITLTIDFSEYWAIALVPMAILFVLGSAGIVIAIEIIAVVRFYKNMVGNEGYLTFTLPVEPYQHILARLITYLVWLVASVLVVILAIAIILVGLPGVHEAFSEIFSAANLLTEGLTGWDIAGVVLHYCLLIILGAAANLSLLFCAMSIGQLFNRHRLLGSVAGYLGLTFAVDIISGGIGLLIEVMALSSVSSFTAIEPASIAEAISGGHLMLLLFDLLYILYASTMFLISSRIFTKRLNLE